MSRIVGSGKDLDVPENISEIAALSGMPAEHAARTVTIAQRAIKTSQGASSFSHQWQITWKPQERWQNPLMGWTSSADPMASVRVIFQFTLQWKIIGDIVLISQLTFDSDQDAIDFANKNGWKYDLLKPADRDVEEITTMWKYKDNFLPPKVIFKMWYMTSVNLYLAGGFGAETRWLEIQNFCKSWVREK